MTAIYRGINDVLSVVPTSTIPAGSVVKLSDGLIGVATSTIAVGERGDLNTKGEYDVEITPGAALKVGDPVTTAAVELDGTATAVEFGPALVAADSTATTVRARLVADRTV